MRAVAVFGTSSVESRLVMFPTINVFPLRSSINRGPKNQPVMRRSSNTHEEKIPIFCFRDVPGRSAMQARITPASTSAFVLVSNANAAKHMAISASRLWPFFQKRKRNPVERKENRISKRSLLMREAKNTNPGKTAMSSKKSARSIRSFDSSKRIPESQTHTPRLPTESTRENICRFSVNTVCATPKTVSVMVTQSAAQK